MPESENRFTLIRGGVSKPLPSWLLCFLIGAMLQGVAVWQLLQVPPGNVTGAVVLIALGLLGTGFLYGAYRLDVRLRHIRRRFFARCGKCGYDLRGIADGKCPECGSSSRAGRFRRMGSMQEEEKGRWSG